MSILKRPGWSGREIITEKMGGRDVPGFSRGSVKIKDLIQPGMQLHTLNRTAGSTTYREAELLFLNFLRQKGLVDSNIKAFATKQVKEIASQITDENLQAVGFADLDELFDSWRVFLQDSYGWELSAASPQSTAVSQVENEVEQSSPAGSEQGAGPTAAAAPAGPSDPTEVLDLVGSKAVKPQHAESADDGKTFTNISFMGQHPGEIIYVRLKNVPKSGEVVGSLKAAKTAGDIITSPILSNFITQIEIESGKNPKIFNFGPRASAMEQEEVVDEVEEDAEEDAEEDSAIPESVKLGKRQQSIIMEKTRITRNQHAMRVEEYYW